jgi:hypothetical protein
MPSEIGQRFLDFILSVAKNETDFSKKIGLNRTDSIYKITKHGSDPGTVTINRVVAAYPEFNVNWLMTGEGNMLSDTPTAASKSIRKPKTETKEEVIPAFDQVVAQQGKMIESLIPTTETDKAGLVKKEMFKNAQFVIRSSGNSMIPNYPPDAWIGIRKIEPKLITPGSVYAIDIGSDLVLKRVYYKDDDQYSGFITCISDNTMVEDFGARKGRLKYPPYEIDMQDIRGVYKVTDIYRPNEITVLR